MLEHSWTIFDYRFVLSSRGEDGMVTFDFRHSSFGLSAPAIGTFLSQ
jgi:hypothetical protein